MRSAKVAIKMLEHIVWTYNKLETFISDNGGEFKNEFNTFLNKYGIQHKYMILVHTQTNGKVK